MEIGGEFEIRMATRGGEKSAIADYVLFSSGQAAIKTILTLLCNEKKITTFLLPNYLCESIYKPFEEMNLAVEFYNINQDLTIDLDDLKKKLTKYEAVYIVNFFNVREPVSTLEFLWNLKKDKIIIEDRTHTFFNEEAGLGHFQLASIRKWMAIPSGAGVIAEDKEDQAKIKKLMVSFNSYSLIEKRLYAAALKEKYLLEEGREPLKEIFLTLFEETKERVYKQVIQLECIDPLSKSILETCDVKEIKEKRRKNYYSLYQALSAILGPANILSGKLNASDVPIGFVISVNDRDLLKRELIKNKIYPPVHWPVASVIKNLDMENPAIISNKILTIPCDQRYSEKDMQRIIQVIKAYYNQYAKEGESAVFKRAENKQVNHVGGA
ncbi:hypothetical protein [Planococcus shixiaomingii]|uniref:hypothetical protein n=1 Tax=Planococcus shixiaomingii TaxID=3058393 RepID=UPI002615BD0B|nr:hypothetical protein [Planococcus sp. N022]WKA53859.1 hypothetical protein QWY21_14475 [Planococcus sp. N022]